MILEARDFSRVRFTREDRVVAGKVSKYYFSTAMGNEVLEEARKRAYELFEEIKD